MAEKTSAYSDINILVVDDEENLANMIVMVLKAKGYQADAVTSSPEGLKLMRTYKYQMVVTDIKMPDITGIDLLKEIKKISSFIQVIMITGFSSLEVALECMENGASDFLFKPFEDLEEVYESVEICAKRIRKWRRIVSKAGKINRLDKYNILNTPA